MCAVIPPVDTVRQYECANAKHIASGNQRLKPAPDRTILGLRSEWPSWPLCDRLDSVYLMRMINVSIAQAKIGV